MRIQHNIMAMNAYRNYNNNAKALSGNLEKLSSGYKINRAGDDAAGLAISEKMRAQITGLDAAQKNVKDGISFVKTAEGAMQEIQDMLNRMKYLATQSANGTYQDEVDREALQDEVNALVSEIDRIAQSANFNGIHMLNGPAAGGNGGGGGGADAIEATVTQADLDGLNETPGTSAFAAGGVKITGLTGDIKKVSINTAAKETTGDGKATVTISGGTLSITLSAAAASGTEVDDAKVTAAIQKAITDDTNLTAEQKTALKDVSFTGLADASKLKTTAGTAVDITPAKGAGTPGSQAAGATNAPTFTEDATNKLASFNIKSIDTKDVEITKESDVKAKYDATNKKLEITIDGTKYTQKTAFTGNAGAGDAAAGSKVTLAAADGSEIEVTLADTVDKIGADQTNDIAEATVGKYTPAAGGNNGNGNGGGGATGTFTISLQIGDTADGYNILQMDIDSVSSVSLGVSTLSVADQTAAQGAIDTILNAINTVSSTRGQLGAYQNRLDHTANNLSVMAENIQDAESTIRDTDVADEMMSYVKNNILVQSAQAMLAQANQVPQGVLQLLG